MIRPRPMMWLAASAAVLSDLLRQDATQGQAAACATGGLSRPARQVHRAVLVAFAATGLPPDRAELDRLARVHDVDQRPVMAELVAADLLAFTADGQIRAAYPFSPTPTAIQVNWDGGPPAWAMCAIDALGMSAMLGRPVTITAAEPQSGRLITVIVDGYRARWSPRSAVVFSGAIADLGGLAADRCCAHINFFSTAGAARNWARRHPEVTGTILRRDGALRIGIDQFGGFLQPTTDDTAGRGR